MTDREPGTVSRSSAQLQRRNEKLLNQRFVPVFWISILFGVQEWLPDPGTPNIWLHRRHRKSHFYWSFRPIFMGWHSLGSIGRFPEPPNIQIQTYRIKHQHNVFFSFSVWHSILVIPIMKQITYANFKNNAPKLLEIVAIHGNTGLNTSYATYWSSIRIDT
jgi:hypothetical protein